VFITQQQQFSDLITRVGYLQDLGPDTSASVYIPHNRSTKINSTGTGMGIYGIGIHMWFKIKSFQLKQKPWLLFSYFVNSLVDQSVPSTLTDTGTFFDRRSKLI